MSPPLRIAMISEHASPIATPGGTDAGGQNVYVDKVSRELAERGHRVDVYTRRDDPGLPAVVPVAPRYRVVHVDAGPPRFVCKEELLPHMGEFSAAIGRHARSQPRHDVVHANFFMSGLAALHLKALYRTPMVMTFHALGLVRRLHQGADDRFPAARIDIERQLVALSDLTVAECPQDATDLQRLYGAAARRMAIVPCGVELDEIAGVGHAEGRQALGLRPDEFVVLQLGRMVPRKGVDDVIRAVARLPRVQPVRLVVVGGDGQADAELARLRALARELGIADRVVFAGQQPRERIGLYYAACDVFVSVPWYEPFGITPLEAMAAGRPVVGSRVGGIQSTVVDGVTGLLVPPRDPPALAQALDGLRLQPRLRHAMGIAGKRRVAREYTWTHVAASLETAYRGLCRPAPVRSTLGTAVAPGIVDRPFEPRGRALGLPAWPVAT